MKKHIASLTICLFLSIFINNSFAQQTSATAPTVASLSKEVNELKKQCQEQKRMITLLAAEYDDLKTKNAEMQKALAKQAPSNTKEEGDLSDITKRISTIEKYLNVMFEQDPEYKIQYMRDYETMPGLHRRISDLERYQSESESSLKELENQIRNIEYKLR